MCLGFYIYVLLFKMGGANKHGCRDCSGDVHSVVIVQGTVEDFGGFFSVFFTKEVHAHFAKWKCVHKKMYTHIIQR